MNHHAPDLALIPNDKEVNAALCVLRAWSQSASDAQIAALSPAVRDLLPQKTEPTSLSRAYPHDFKADAAYKATLPDLQNSAPELIRGAHTRIQHVGISNFRLPLRYRKRDGNLIMLETSVSGTVSLEADKKGINMSRIMRSFYKHSDKEFDFDVIEAALDDYKASLESHDARIMLRLSYPCLIQSLRSGLSGYQYYDIALELIETQGVRKRIIHLDYVYSSTCPCSLELSEHARTARGQLATPHSQRSVARLSCVLNPKSEPMHMDDLIDACRRAVPTETQVMVKREDEQAFAELNAANPVFVEDAARLFCEQIHSDARIGDFRVMASHQESLHSHDAVSILTQGPTFAQQSLDPKIFNSLAHIS